MGIVSDRVQELKTMCTPPTVSEPMYMGNTAWIAEKLLDAGILNEGMHHKALDSKYWCCSRLDFDAIIKWDWTNNKRYVSEKYDCDNFAFSFKARMDRRFHLNNVGLVVDYSGGHAYNCVVFSDGTAELFEPQGDRFPVMNKTRGLYRCESGFIVI